MSSQWNASRSAAHLPFRIVVLGDFACSPSTSAPLRTPIDKDTFRQVLAASGVELTFSVPNHLASVPSHLEVSLPIETLGDFEPQALVRKIPALSTLARFRELVGRVRQGQVDRNAFMQQLEEYSGLDGLAEPIRLCVAAWDTPPAAARQPPEPAPPPTRSGPPQPSETTDAVERILEMVETPEPADTQSPERQREVSEALRGVLAQLSGPGKAGAAVPRSPLEQALQQTERVMSRQLNACMHHPTFQEAETTWRGVKFLVDRCDIRENIHIDITQVTKSTIAETLHTAVVETAHAEPDDMPPAVILVGMPIDKTSGDLQLLRRLAEGAEAIQAPLVFAVEPSFFGLATAEDMTQLSVFGALFDRPEYAKWVALGQRSSARWLAAAYNRFLLRPLYGPDGLSTKGLPFAEAAEDGRGYLWGNPVWALGSVMAQSVARFGWPTEIVGQEDGRVADLPVRPCDGHGRGVVQIPLESFLTVPLAQDLHAFGFTPLTCAANSDAAFVVRAPTLYQPPGYSSQGTRDQTRLQHSLAYQLFVGKLVAIVSRHINRLIPGQSPRDVETSLEVLLGDLMADSGPGNRVAIHIEHASGRHGSRRLVLSLRSGNRVLRGAEAELQVDLPLL